MGSAHDCGLASKTSGCATLWGCSMVHRGKNIVNGTPSPCCSPPLVVPRGGGGGDRHLVNPKFFVVAHCVVVWVTLLWGTTTCIP